MTDVWLIVTSPTTSSSPDGVMPQTAHTAFLLTLQEGETETDAVERFAVPTMVGTEVKVVDAGGARPYSIGARAVPA